MNIPVLFEDNWFMILNKPSGLLVVPARKNHARTLTGILNDDLKEKGLPYRLHPCHRLDRETSGLIVYAKGKSAQKKMMDIFKDKKIKKTYIAFIQGRLSREEGEIKGDIEGLTAVTRYRVIAERKDFSILRIIPLTGRTNQIRIHFKHIGHPLVGESKFAFRKDYKLKAKRVCLHAKTLEFVHPLTGMPVIVDTDLPADLKKFLAEHPD